MGFEWAVQTSHTPNPANPGGGAIDKSPFEIAAKRLEANENGNRAGLMRHFCFLALNFALNNLQLSPKPHLSERRSNTICAVVERPDHHCGDDRVNVTKLVRFETRTLHGFQRLHCCYC